MKFIFRGKWCVQGVVVCVNYLLRSLGIDTNNMYQQWHPTIRTTATSVPIQTRNIPTISSLDKNYESCNLGDDKIETWGGNNIQSRCNMHFDYEHVCEQYSGSRTILTPSILVPTTPVNVSTSPLPFNIQAHLFVDDQIY